MHDKNMELLGVLKLIKAEFMKKQTEPSRTSKELTEEEQIKVLLKMASQREDSIRQYIDGGRRDLADAEQKELNIISTFTVYKILIKSMILSYFISCFNETPLFRNIKFGHPQLVSPQA